MWATPVCQCLLNSCFEMQNLVCAPHLYFKDKCLCVVNNIKYFPVIPQLSETGWLGFSKESLWRFWILQIQVSDSFLIIFSLLSFSCCISGERLWTLLPVLRQLCNEWTECLKICCLQVKWVISLPEFACVWDVYSWWQKDFLSSLILSSFAFCLWSVVLGEVSFFFFFPWPGKINFLQAHY